MKKQLVLLAALMLLFSAGSAAFAAEAQRADIEQHIYERHSADRSLSPFKEVTEDQPLLPAVGEAELSSSRWFIFQHSNVTKPIFGNSLKNELDRFVFVENTGDVGVYVRTWFAFEQGSYGKSVLDELIHLNFNTEDWTMGTVSQGVEIDGNKYTLFHAYYSKILEPGKTAEPSLMQLYMDSSGDNDDMLAIDGNGSGKYELMIYSQAVQAENFNDAKSALDAAFSAEHPWQKQQ